MVTYIGIDPGLSGAVGVVSANGVWAYDTPVLWVEGKRKYHAGAMALLLKPFVDVECLVVLEAVHSMPKQGVASSFTFGEGLGMWKGIVAAFELPLELPSPQRWKKEIMADMGRDKDASILKAIQLFPTIASQLSRKKDDGRAEALLLAEYGRRLRKGQ